MKRFTSINADDILETLLMIHDENLDVRTVTMGINLLDCADPDPQAGLRQAVRKDCAPRGEARARVRAHLHGIRHPDRQQARGGDAHRAAAGVRAGRRSRFICQGAGHAADTVGINFIGGYSALVHKGFAAGRRAASQVHPAGAERDREGVLQREHRHHEIGHQHGRGGDDGGDHPGNREENRRTQLHRRGEAGGVLQRAGG